MRSRVVSFMLLSLAFHVVPNILIDKYLSKYSVASLLVIWEFMTLVISIVVFTYYYQSSEPMVHPEWGWPMVIISITALTYYLADFFFIASYHAGGNIITITSIMIALPVVTGLVKGIMEQQLPSWKHLVSYLVVAIGIALFIYAEAENPEKTVLVIP